MATPTSKINPEASVWTPPIRAQSLTPIADHQELDARAPRFEPYTYLAPPVLQVPPSWPENYPQEGLTTHYQPQEPYHYHTDSEYNLQDRRYPEDAYCCLQGSYYHHNIEPHQYTQQTYQEQSPYPHHTYTPATPQNQPIYPNDPFAGQMRAVDNIRRGGYYPTTARGVDEWGRYGAVYRYGGDAEVDWNVETGRLKGEKRYVKRKGNKGRRNRSRNGVKDVQEGECNEETWRDGQEKE